MKRTTAIASPNSHCWAALTAMLLLFAIQDEVTAIEPRHPMIVAHRGLLRHAPENTLANFRACLELRMGFELDVRRTSNGKLVCIHDTTLDRTTNGKGPIERITLGELKKLDAGSWYNAAFKGERVPTIDEVFAIAAEYRRHKFLLAVDLKVVGAEAELVKLAEKHKILEHLLFIGETIHSGEIRDRLRRASAKANVAMVAHDAAEAEKAIRSKNASWVYFRYLPDRKETRAAQKLGKRTFIAGKLVSGDEPDNWAHATGVGLDAILTDFPLRLREEQRYSDQ